MKTLLQISTVLVVTALTASALTEEKINETRDAKPGGKLVVDVDFGTIEVVPGNNDKVVINARRKIETSSKEKEEEYIRETPITITTEGTTVSVRAQRKNNRISWNWHGTTNMDAHYTIHVPANFNADLQTAGGDVSARNLTGNTKVETSGGDLKFSQLRGPLEAESAGGDIEVAACEGAIKIETSGGRIEVQGGSGSLEASTAGGSVAVGNFAGDAKVENSGGKLALKNIGGKLHGETAGGSISARLPSPVPGDVRLETSAGAIEVLAPSDAALTVDAETSVGSVTSDFPITMTRAGNERLKGTINGGGKLLKLRSGAGSIAIKSASEVAQQ
jgi:DUF4097 and DUF4098 domain-containing protein YvlB